MKRLCLIAVLLLAGKAHAQCVVGNGSTQGAFQTAINTAATNSCASPATHTVQLAAGNDVTISSQMTMTCPSTSAGMIIQGPVLATNVWPITPTAIITGNVGLNWAFTAPACNNPTTIQFIQYNGGKPSSGGGGFMFGSPGLNKLSVQYSWFYGVSAVQNQMQSQDTFFFFGNNSTSGTPNNTILFQFNQFGKTGSGDCGGQANVGNQGLMNLYGGANLCSASGYAPPGGSTHCQYQGASDLTHGGGACGAIGISNNFAGLTIRNNSFVELEQPIKFYECSGTGCSWSSSGLLVQANDMAGVHRIGNETQFNDVSTGSNFLWDSNDFHDPIKPSAGQWGLSLPQGTTDSKNNVLIANTAISNDKNGDGASWAGDGLEFWGTGTSSNNLIQGLWNSGIEWGFGGPPRAILNNTLQGNPMSQPSNICSVSVPNRYFVNEECTSPAPTISGNVTSPTVTAITSVAPLISPPSGTQSFPLTVTFTDSGYTSGAQPLGNTGIWYTTDGSTPVPGSGTAKRVDSGGQIVLLVAATVKAVGMWGALNQPTFYPSGFGFVPSAVVTNTFSGSGLFISPTGNDANPGTSGSPWLTPNHAMTCGGTITALPGTYSAANFQNGDWGTVTCTGANNVAWLACQTFDTCKISSTTTSAMHIDKSFWGVQGWEVTTSSNVNASGFQIEPAPGTVIHHIILANNVVNGAVNGGISAYNNGIAGGSDYLAFIGNVVYNAASTSAVCASGINIYEPIASDTASGTHMYIAGNFSYSNLNPNPCAGGTPTDGEGIIIDTWDGHQNGTPVYKQQGVIQNNISVGNGGRGIQVEYNNVSPPNATVFVKNNTTYGNEQDPNQPYLGLGECMIQSASLTTYTGNLCVTSSANTPAGHPVYAFAVTSADSSDSVAGNWLAGQSGNNTFIFSSGSFAYGSNTLGTSPAFASTTIPGAPSCTGKTSVPNCMATLIANFTPTAGGSAAFGYQAPSNTSVTDVLFPQWLCAGTGVLNPSIPANLITPGCGGGSTPTITGGHQANSGNVNTLFVGAPAVQQVAVVTYSDGSSQNLPDTFGNTAVWSSADPTKLTVGSTGLISCIAPTTGAVNSLVSTSPGGQGLSPWGWTCLLGGLSSGMVCKGGGSPSGGLPGPGGTAPTQGLACHP